MEIVLHVGAHRTATTTLQRMMGQSRPALMAGRIDYWGPKRTRGGLFRGLFGAPEATLPWDVTRALNRIRMRAAGAAKAGAQAIFLSEENMLGSLRDVFDANRLYPGAGDRVARIANGFGGRGITVGLGIRCYDAWWTSALAFRLPRGGRVPNADFCDHLVTQPRRWRHVVADLAQAMPQARIVVWTFERMGAQADRLVCSLIGRRIALDGAAAHLNRMATPHHLRAYLTDCGIETGLLRTQSGRFMPFDEHQRAILRAQYAEDLAWLHAGAGGLADYLDAPVGFQPGRTDQEEGLFHDRTPRQHRRLA